METSDKHEKRIVTALSDAEKPLSITNIGVVANIHHHKLPDIINRLLENGIIKEERIGRYLKYSLK